MKPHGGARRFQDIITASDVTTILNRSYRADITLGGSGVMQWYDLGDARLYVPSRTYFIFYNDSTEFVGIKNSDLTVWHRVPPRARCICALRSGLTAAGVWFSEVVRDQNPAHGLDYVEDYHGGSVLAASGAHFVSAANGASAAVACNFNLSYSQGGRLSTAIARTGSTAVGYALIRTGLNNTGLFLGNGCRALEQSQGLDALSTAAEEYIFRFGFGDVVSGGAHTNGCYIVYDRATDGDVFALKNITGAGNNKVVTAVVPTLVAAGANWQKLRVEVDSGRTRSDFFIDNAQVSPAGGLNTFVPAAATNLYGTTGITKTVGVTGRQLHMDYTRIQTFPTTLR